MVLSPPMARVVVTGGAGFVGSAVVDELRRAGDHVAIAGLGSASDPLNAGRLAEVITPNVDLIVHCAGSASVSASVVDPTGEHAKTVPAFALLLDRVRNHAPGARVVLLSNAAVYGNTAIVPTPETAALAPVSPYGEDKRACEELCRAHRGATAIVRLFSVDGAGLRKQLLWDACKKASSGVPRFAGTGDEERDWLHVSDAASLIVLAAAHATNDAPVINGGAGVGVKVREVVGQVCRELGTEPVFTGQPRAGDPPRYVADITHARELGWQPRIDLVRGIADYVTWFRAHA
ncbi:NAD-dependent epimerase/dehydratase family protein [soil metagenome]